MTERNLYILRMGPTLPELSSKRGEFDDWVRPHLGWPAGRVRTLTPAEDAPLPPPAVVAGVVVTGAASMVTERLPWMLRTAEWLRQLVAAEVPLLGICFGHQLLAQALGGEVDDNPKGPEVGTVPLRWLPAAASDPLFADLPPVFHVTHQQSVLRLPPGAVLLAESDGDPHQAFRVGANAWGVQFHPEFDGPITRVYVDRQAELLRRHGQDPEALRRQVADTSAGPQLLARFGAMACG